MESTIYYSIFSGRVSVFKMTLLLLRTIQGVESFTDLSTPTLSIAEHASIPGTHVALAMQHNAMTT